MRAHFLLVRVNANAGGAATDLKVLKIVGEENYCLLAFLLQPLLTEKDVLERVDKSRQVPARELGFRAIILLRRGLLP